MKHAVSFLLVFGILWAAAPSAVGAEYVILPEQQPLVETLFAEDLSGGWGFVRADIKKSVLVLEYAHDAPVARVLLRVAHPETATGPKLRTERFAVTVEESSASPAAEAALLDALGDRLRAGETSWVWKSVSDPVTDDYSNGDERRVAGALHVIGDRLHRGREAALGFGAAVAYKLSFGRVAYLGYATQAAARRARRAASAAEAALDQHATTVFQGQIRRVESLLPELSPHDRFSVGLQIGFLLGEAGARAEMRPWIERAITEGEALIEAMRAEDPGRFMVRVDVARARLGIGAVPDATALAEQLLDQATDSAHRCRVFFLVRTLAQMDRVPEAVALGRRLIGKLPDCQAGYRVIGALSMTGAREEDLSDILTVGAARFPDDVGVVSSLANHYKFHGQKDKTLELLEGLVARGHTNAGLLGEIMGMYARTPERSAHETRFIKAATERPDDPIAAFFAGALLHYRKDYEESTRHLLRALPALPHVPRIHLYLAMNHHRSGGDHAEAVRYIERAVGVDSTDPDVFYCRGVIHMDDDPDAAIKDLETYLSMTRESWDIPPYKTETVDDMVKKLKSCRTAEIPSECVGIDPP